MIPESPTNCTEDTAAWCTGSTFWFELKKRRIRNDHYLLPCCGDPFSAGWNPFAHTADSVGNLRFPVLVDVMAFEGGMDIYSPCCPFIRGGSPQTGVNRFLNHKEVFHEKDHVVLNYFVGGPWHIARARRAYGESGQHGH